MKIQKSYQPEVIGIIVGLAALNIWYLSSVAITESVLPKNYDYLIGALSVASGAFIGAFSAFWLKSYEESNKEREARKNALNSALFVLVRKINAIGCIKRDLENYTTPFDRGLSLPAMKPPDYSDLRQDIYSLHFLIDIDKPQVLLDLTLEQERFEQAINSINIRNDFYVNEVQPALSFHSLNGRPLPLSEFEEKLGERLFQGAIQGAATMYELVYSSEASLHDKYEELRSLAKSLFPGEKFVGWHAVQAEV